MIDSKSHLRTMRDADPARACFSSRVEGASVHDEKPAHSRCENHVGSLQRAVEAPEDCGTEDDGLDRAELPLRRHGVLRRFHHGSPVGRPLRMPAVEVVVGNTGLAGDESIRRARGEAATLPLRTLSS